MRVADVRASIEPHSHGGEPLFRRGRAVMRVNMSMSAGSDGSCLAPPLQFAFDLAAVMAEEIKNGVPPRSLSCFHIKLHIFDDFIEMAQRGFQFVLGAFIEELHGLSIRYLTRRQGTRVFRPPVISTFSIFNHTLTFVGRPRLASGAVVRIWPSPIRFAISDRAAEELGATIG